MRPSKPTSIAGVFQTTFFPVEGTASRESEIEIAHGDDVLVQFRDLENLDPGVPWDRTTLIEQVVKAEPEFRLYASRTELLTEEEIKRVRDRMLSAASRLGEGKVDEAAIDSALPTLRLIVDRPAESIESDVLPEEMVSHVLGTSLLAEVKWPMVAKSTASQLTIYAQTAYGRELVGADPEDSYFDITVPGTIALTTAASEAAVNALPAGVASSVLTGVESLGAALDDGLFTVSIPVLLGDCPEESMVDEDTMLQREDLGDEFASLFVTRDDVIIVGFRFEDDNGEERWFTHRATLVGTSQFTVMDREFADVVTSEVVGEKVYFKVKDPIANETPDKDTVSLNVVAQSGASVSVDLFETLPHSGEFRGLIELSHKDEPTDPNAIITQFSVIYGDTFTASYTDSAGSTIDRLVTIDKGLTPS